MALDGSSIFCDDLPKAFVQRDYSEGMTVRFEKKLPTILEGKIDGATFADTVEKLNAIYFEGEELSMRTCCEGLWSCLTCYFLLLCITPHYTKVLDKASKFIREQNESIYARRGLILVDPAERGLRVLEIGVTRAAADVATL